MGKSKGKSKNSSKESGNLHEKNHSRGKSNRTKNPSHKPTQLPTGMSDIGTQKLTKRDKKQSNGTVPTLGPSSLQDRLMERKEREKIVLWRRPFFTLKYFLLESFIVSKEYLFKLWNFKKCVLLVGILLIALYVASISQGPHQHMLQLINQNMWWCMWWVWLGILSSVGLGTGLHTFLLYLGPHIASVTIAAYLCNSVDFPSPPYPDEIICPEDDRGSEDMVMSIWRIMSKVRLEAFMWGAGTALGELPPYFMARGARLSGKDLDDEELQEFEELQKLKEHPEEMSWLDTTKLSIEKLVEKVGFFGILACASIPNPLFDLAGITCGHFLVPFWTFFGATLIGKAVIKMHIQKMFVIIAFNEPLLEWALGLVSRAPVIGPWVQKPFADFLQNQKKKLRRKAHVQGGAGGSGGNALSWIFEKIIVVMVTYFLVSIVNSLAQNYHKRLCKKRGPHPKKASD